MTSTNVKPKAKGLPVLAIMLLCILVASCGVLSKKEEQKQTDPVSWREQSTYIEIAKISDPITPEGMKPIQYTGNMVKQDDSMYPEYVESLKKGLIKKDDTISSFKGEYLDSIPAIVQKVLPDVYFIKGQFNSIRSINKRKLIVGYYKDKYVNCVTYFNDLYFRMNHNKTDILLNEKLLAIFVCRYKMDKKINIKISNITPIEERQIKNTNYSVNYKFSVDISGKPTHEDLLNRIEDDKGDWYFYDDNGVILFLGHYGYNNYFQKIFLGYVSSSL